jgi:hypothetical protein
MDPNPNPVTITITPGYPPKVHPESHTLHLARDEEVVWECRDAAGRNKEFKVVFKGESPFDERTFHPGRPHSGRPRPDVAPDRNKRYPYAVVADGTLDPDLIVDY